MELEELLKAFEDSEPVVLKRPLEGDLRFERIVEIIPAFDKRGQPDYGATVVDRVGRPCHVRGKNLEIRKDVTI